MFIMFMNDMRGPHYERTEPVVRADTLERLWAFLKSEHVPGGYMDGKWGKTFKMGGPLEWFNCPLKLDAGAPSEVSRWGDGLRTLGTRDDCMSHAAEGAGAEWDSLVMGTVEAPQL